MTSVPAVAQQYGRFQALRKNVFQQWDIKKHKITSPSPHQ
jgi:hypothetical protein